MNSGRQARADGVQRKASQGSHQNVQHKTSNMPGLGGSGQLAQLLAGERGDGKKPEADLTKNKAAEGIDGPARALPHGDEIQQSFGHHDISGVRAHTGPDAKEAAEGMGAEAYASGDDVAFASDPDLHTAAHEAAHTVQQKAGAIPEDGVGTPGDRFEANANAAADAVVQGKSAEGILDKVARAGKNAGEEKKAAEGSRAGGRSGVLQKKSFSAEEKKKYQDGLTQARRVQQLGEVVQEALGTYIEEERVAIQDIELSASILVKTYDAAYTRHEDVIKSANLQAESRQALLDFVLGIVLGAATAGASTALFPTGQAFSIGRAFAEEFVSQTGSTMLSGTVLDIGKMVTPAKRENKEAERWKLIADLFEKIVDLVPMLQRVAQITQGAIKVSADCDKVLVGGQPAQFHSLDELEKAVAALGRDKPEYNLQAIQHKVSHGLKDLLHFQQEMEKAQTTTAIDMEKHIWTKWIADLEASGRSFWSLKDQYDQLDSDVIEDHLESIGLDLGHDPGNWKSDEDERILRESARSKLEILKMKGAVGKAYKRETNEWFLWTIDNQSISCQKPDEDSNSKLYEVLDAVSFESWDMEKKEPRIGWQAKLNPLSRREAENRGIHP